MKFRNLVLLLPFLLCCCNKIQPPPVTPPGFAFTTTYDSIITCTANTSKLLVFNTTVLSSSIDSNPVTYAISGLPPNISVAPASQTVTLLLGGVFTFTIGDMPAGNDTASFIISSTATGSHTHKLIFRIAAATDYSTRLAGTYLSSFDYCTPIDSLYNYTATASTVVDTPYEIKISNLKNLGAGFVVRAKVSTILTIPPQTMSGYTIWGSGTYTHDNPPYDTLFQMAIHDTLVYGSDTEHCTIHLQH